MITETGQIAVIADGEVWVDCTSRSHCQRCSEGRGCGGAIFGRLIGDQQYRVKAKCQHDSPAVGEPVSLLLDESVILRAAGLVYLLPLAGLLLGAAVGHFLAGDLLALIGGSAGFLIAVFLARRLARGYFAGLQPVARKR